MLEELQHVAESIELALEIARKAIAGGDPVEGYEGCVYRWRRKRFEQAWVEICGLLEGARIELAGLQVLADGEPRAERST